MLYFVVLFNLIFLICVAWLVDCISDEDGDSDFGAALITNLRNDANLDLSVDDEYEDLRAELLAYHTALASLSSAQNRRSMMTTPCWQAGGICVNVQLCTGFRFLTEIPGCKDRFNVCCFAWNKYRVKDLRDKGIGVLSMPWSQQQKFGGKGVIEATDDLESETDLNEVGPNKPSVIRPGKSGPEMISTEHRQLLPQNYGDSLDNIY